MEFPRQYHLTCHVAYGYCVLKQEPMDQIKMSWLCVHETMAYSKKHC